MSQADVSTLRHFNRQFTQRIGVLDERFLGQNRSLGPARLLFEIGRGGAKVLDLRSRLGLDSGYLSRLLRGLESEGLISVEPDPDDRRRRIATLTSHGQQEWNELEVRSEQLAQRLVAPLSATHRARLDDALITAERILASATATFDVVDLRSSEAAWAVTQYFSELNLRFDEGFDAGGAIDEEAPQYDAPYGVFVVVHCDGAAIACGGLCTLEHGVGEIKRMWVSEYFRGVGLGPRLLAELEDHSRRLGHQRVLLDTNSSLTEAIAMYHRNGYAEIERYNDNPYAQRWCEKKLSG